VTGWLYRHRMAAAVAAFLVAGQTAIIAAYGSEIHRVTQKSRAFSAKEVNVAVGDTVQFGNDDEFIHQVYVESKTFNFDTAESSPGDNIDIKFTVAGTFEVHCHIHPKMGLVVNVK
jgi:plastocyanin